MPMPSPSRAGIAVDTSSGPIAALRGCTPGRSAVKSTQGSGEQTGCSMPLAMRCRGAGAAVQGFWAQGLVFLWIPQPMS